VIELRNIYWNKIRMDDWDPDHNDRCCGSGPFWTGSDLVISNRIRFCNENSGSEYDHKGGDLTRSGSNQNGLDLTGSINYQNNTDTTGSGSATLLLIINADPQGPFLGWPRFGLVPKVPVHISATTYFNQQILIFENFL